jgi:hypothetical protein
MKEVMYDQSSLLIAGILFFSIVAAIELGHRIGRRARVLASESSRDHVNAIQASLLGVLALLLGFTFSLSLQRYDSRSEAVVQEANAIGTAYLRAQLLPASVRGEAQQRLQSYLGLRVQAGAVALDREEDRVALLAQSNRELDLLWGYARQAAEEDGRVVTSGLFIQSLNELIDAYGRRDAALKRHVPEVVLFLLYGTFVLTGIVVGYAAGAADHRPSFTTLILVALIVILAFVIVDLDRPRRGLIKIDHTSLNDLKAAIDLAQAAGTRQQGTSDLPRPAVTGRR